MKFEAKGVGFELHASRKRKGGRHEKQSCPFAFRASQWQRERERKEGLESTVASLSCKLVRYYNRNGVSRLFGATTYAPMLSRYIVSSVEHWPCSYLNRNWKHVRRKRIVVGERDPACSAPSDGAPSHGWGNKLFAEKMKSVQRIHARV